MHSRICLKSLSFLGRLPLSLFCSCLLFVFVLYFSFKARHPLAVGQREKPNKLNKFSWDCRNWCMRTESFRRSGSDLNFGVVYLFKPRCLFLHPHLKYDLFICSRFLSWKRLASAAFWAGALFLVLAGSSSSHAERPQPFLSVQSRSHSVPLMEQSTTGGDYSLPLVHFNSPTALCYYFRKTHIIKTQGAQTHTHTLLPTSVELPKQLSWTGSIYGHGMKSMGVSPRLQRGAAVLEWPVDKLYPMSYVNHRRVIQADSE